MPKTCSCTLPIKTACVSVLLLLTFVESAEAIPPPELVRIGTVFVQSLAVGLVFLSTVLFFLRTQISRLFAAMQSRRRILVGLTAAFAFIGAVWGGSAVYTNHQNRLLTAEANQPNEAPVSNDSVVAQLNVADPTLVVTPREASALMTTGAHIFLDVREPVEIATRSIPGFANLRLGDLISGKKYQQLDKNKTIVTLCEFGERGSNVAALLRMKGFRAVYVEKGIRGWIAEKLPFDGNVDMKLPDFDNKYAKVTEVDAQEMRQAGTALLIDVRSPAAFKKEHVEGAINIPLVNMPSSDLEMIVNEFPPEKKAVGVAYNRFGRYYCMIFGHLLAQKQKAYGGTLNIPPKS
jgi:rhodanese-related sulfurtransferase